jgi:hypothetical protein
MATSRRSFLRTAAGSAVGSLALPGLAGAAAPVSADWDMSWVDRIRGTHRGVFDTAELAEGVGMFRAGLWPSQIREVYGAVAGDLTPVLVLRHNAIHFIMNDAYWAEFKVGKSEKLKDPETNGWAVRNIIRAQPAWAPPTMPMVSIEGFLAGGGIILACDLAFGQVIGTFASKKKLEMEAARAAALAQVLPGVIMQPSGFFAVMRAQQAGCGYIVAH